MSRLDPDTTDSQAGAPRRSRLLTVAEVAQYWGVSSSTVRRWIADDELEAIRSPGGGAVRVPSSAVPGYEEDL